MKTQSTSIWHARHQVLAHRYYNTKPSGGEHEEKEKETLTNSLRQSLPTEEATFAYRKHCNTGWCDLTKHRSSQFVPVDQPFGDASRRVPQNFSAVSYPRMRTRSPAKDTNSQLHSPLKAPERGTRKHREMYNSLAPFAGAGVPSNGYVPFFAPITAPILCSVDAVEVARFLKERKRYGIESIAKQAEAPSLRTLLSSASIDRTLLKSVIYIRKFDKIAREAASAKTPNDEHIKTYVKSLVLRSDLAVVDPSIIKSPLSDFSMSTRILDAEERITTYCTDYFKRLESVGCRSTIESSPKGPVRLLCSRVHLKALKREMRKRLDYDASLENSVKLFVKVLTQEAITCQTYAVPKASEPAPSKRREPDRDRVTSKNAGRPEKYKKEKPVCMYSPHKGKGFRHYLEECRDCPEDQKDELFEEFREQKKDTARRTSALDIKDKHSTVLFSGTFVGRVRTTVCPDIGFAVTLMDADMLSRIEKADHDVQAERLDPPRQFDMAAENLDGFATTIACDHAVTLDIHLHIRHGSALLLRGLCWLVRAQFLDEPLFGRPLQKGIRLDCCKVLFAAADTHGGTVDVSAFIANSSVKSLNRIGRVPDGVFHADGGADNADFGDDDEWLHLGPKDPAEQDRVLKIRLEQAKNHGLSPSGCHNFEKLLREFSNNIKLKLDSGEPADIEPLKVQLKPDAMPIRAKQPRYPQPKREFVTRYVQQLLKVGFVKKVSSPKWVSAALMVPKQPLALYRLTADYRLLNTVTRPTFWLVPNIESKLASTRIS